ncbi:hypothetical protein BZA77DRAFT_386349 [Pyronema omphalodes]|nr:hypothetical protein BZA77DRAFT_386349 [Pyronema omphalodes]
MSPLLGNPNYPSNSSTSSGTSEARLEDAHSRDQILQQIAQRQGIVRELECDYIAWRLPPIATKCPLEPKGKAPHVTINTLALCSPGAAIFSPGKLTHFTATTETRCIRDLKRPFSWKVYGVSCASSGETAYYVRISFPSASQDSLFSPIALLLDSISAKRHVVLSSIHPFGLGMDYGVPTSHSNRIFAITHCAKITPHNRRVAVHLEIYLENQWKRINMPVDRLGFAVYKSALKSDIILAPGPEEIKFVDDAYVRFARMTLRFGERRERAYIDIEHSGMEKPCYVHKIKKGGIVYIPTARVRTCDADGTTRSPVRTMCRLVFSEEKTGLFTRGGGFTAAAEAEKAASLIRKTTRTAATNPIGIKACITDEQICEMNMKGVVSERGYMVTNEEDGHTFNADIRDKFRGCVVYAVPSLRGDGMVLISHSRDGEAVLRQHIDNPIDLITNISTRGFGVPCNSTLVRCKDGKRSIGRGMIRYSFNYGDTDAAILVDKLVNLFAKIAPLRRDEVKTALQQKRQQRKVSDVSGSRKLPSPPPNSETAAKENLSMESSTSRKLAMQGRLPKTPTTPSHARSSSNISNMSAVSGYSELSNASTVDEREINCGKSDFDIYETPQRSASTYSQSLESPPRNNPGQLFRVNQDYEGRWSREVVVVEGDVVQVEFKNKFWCFVRLVDGTEGWLPVELLDI